MLIIIFHFLHHVVLRLTEHHGLVLQQIDNIAAHCPDQSQYLMERYQNKAEKGEGRTPIAIAVSDSKHCQSQCSVQLSTCGGGLGEWGTVSISWSSLCMINEPRVRYWCWSMVVYGNLCIRDVCLDILYWLTLLYSESGAKNKNIQILLELFQKKCLPPPNFSPVSGPAQLKR